MTQSAYTSLNNAIDNEKPEAVNIGGRKIRVLPVARRGKTAFRITWGSRGERKTRETSNPEMAREVVKTLVKTASQMTALEAAVPMAEVERTKRALAQYPGVTVEQLVEAFRKQSEAPPSRPIPVLVDELILQTKARERSARQIQTIRSHLRRFAKAFPTEITSLTSEDLDRYLSQFPHPKTRNNHRTSICTLFNHARRRGDLPYQMATAADRTLPAKVVRQEPGVLPTSDLEALLKKCDDPALKAFLVIGAFAGCRSAEILRLRWKNITPEGIFLTSDITKTNRRRVVEISANLQAWLDTIPRRDEESRVTYAHGPILYESLRALCKEARVTWVPNGLRHGFVSHHLELHGDAIRTSKNTGHSLRELETDYLKLVSKTEAAKWFNIFPEPKT